MVNIRLFKGPLVVDGLAWSWSLFALLEILLSLAQFIVSQVSWQTIVRNPMYEHHFIINNFVDLFGKLKLLSCADGLIQMLNNTFPFSFENYVLFSIDTSACHSQRCQHVPGDPRFKLIYDRHYCMLQPGKFHTGTA